MWSIFGTAHSSTKTWPSNATRESREYTTKLGFPEELFYVKINVMLTILWEIQPVLVWHFSGMHWQKNHQSCIKVLPKNVLAYIQYSTDFAYLRFSLELPASNGNV